MQICICMYVLYFLSVCSSKKKAVYKYNMLSQNLIGWNWLMRIVFLAHFPIYFLILCMFIQLGARTKITEESLQSPICLLIFNNPRVGMGFLRCCSTCVQSSNLVYFHIIVYIQSIQIIQLFNGDYVCLFVR